MSEGPKWTISTYFRFYPWDSPECDKIAKLDHIYPATGIAMGELFNNMYYLLDKGQTPTKFQIITWAVEL